ncbi:SDR family NAD(P)-dependent oxidoreductase [Sphingosinicella soli]|uniref:Serine 3-dehydrogenase n=1 Tax=Sphingosinicella soli TaxID=333708 RepID=A0A7W7B3F0_9SPHN|nr:SDR family NAD(P)-dependent oxidoreductase [Sphingosinicella soli]MBB4632388.1 serine 3-dehydrogenase [Sphingosinicella soli]
MNTVFITGATSGIGSAAVNAFADAGWKVIAAGRRTERLEALASPFGADTVHTVTMDVRDSGAISQAVESLPQPFRDIDLLINNAGLALAGAATPEAELDQWKTMIDTNIVGLITLTQHLLPVLSERRGGIINISSVAASYPFPGGKVYGGTKAFVTQFSQCLRADLHGKGVRVTSIEPGLVETEFMLVRNLDDRNLSDAMYRNACPLAPDDIAGALLWVAGQPRHVNINRLEIMPVSQSMAGFRIARSDA